MDINANPTNPNQNDTSDQNQQMDQEDQAKPSADWLPDWGVWVWAKVALFFQLLIANAPLALISLPASYGAAKFSEKFYPEPWNIILGGAFESAYLGGIIFARRKSRTIFVITIMVAASCGIIYNWLNVAQVDGLLTDWDKSGRWLLAFIHGAPLSLLGVAYAVLMHFSSDDAGGKTNTISNASANANSTIEVKVGFLAWLFGAKREIAQAVNKASQTWEEEKSKLVKAFETQLDEAKSFGESLSGQVSTLQHQVGEWSKWWTAFQPQIQAEQQAALDTQQRQFEEQLTVALEKQRKDFETTLRDQLLAQANQYQADLEQRTRELVQELQAAQLVQQPGPIQTLEYSDAPEPLSFNSREGRNEQVPAHSQLHQEKYEDVEGDEEEYEDDEDYETTTPSNTAADGGSLGHVQKRKNLLNRFKREKSVEVLIEAYAIHVQLDTLEQWVRRYAKTQLNWVETRDQIVNSIKIIEFKR